MVALALVVLASGPVSHAWTIKIGSCLALTGVGAPEGGPQQKGIVLAEKHINEAGGPLDQTFKVLHTDSQSEPGASVAAVTKLVKLNRIPILLGGWSSGCSIAMSKVTIPNRVIQIGTGCTSPEITYLDDNDYFFRTSPSDTYQGIALAMLARAKGYKTASTIVVNNQYGIGIEQVFKEAWTKAGGTLHNMMRVAKGLSSYRSELQLVFGTKPDVVINAAYPVDITVMLKQWYELDLVGKWLAAEVAKAPSLPEKLGYEIFGQVEGVAMAQAETEGAKRFYREFREEFHTEPAVFSPHAYDATMIAALAIQKAGTATDTEAIRKAIREVANPPGEVVTVHEFGKAKKLLAEGKEIQYVGASGVVDFDEHGDTVNAMAHWGVDENNRFVTLGVFTPEEIMKFAKEIGFVLPRWWEEEK
jgi:ABC-type branched-subunit amino acid transport system substrate-binding protein